MKKQIWKYCIKEKVREIEIPTGGKVLAVGNQFETVCIWVELDPKQPTEKRIFEIFDTGQEIHYSEGTNCTYLGSAKLHDGATILHVYERRF